jgi:hypothetical protein
VTRWSQGGATIRVRRRGFPRRPPRRCRRRMRGGELDRHESCLWVVLLALPLLSWLLGWMSPHARVTLCLPCRSPPLASAPERSKSGHADVRKGGGGSSALSSVGEDGRGSSKSVNEATSHAPAFVLSKSHSRLLPMIRDFQVTVVRCLEFISRTCGMCEHM